MCNSTSLLGILSLVKRAVLLIQIFVPIILIVSVIMSFIKLTNNPETKDGHKKIINQILAAAIIFFIPFLVDFVMGLVGEKTKFSSCWNEASEKISLGTIYYDISGKPKQQFMPDANNYEKGNPADGKAIAELAVRVVPNAEPDSRIIHHANLHNGVDRATIDSRMHNYIKIMDATTTKHMKDDWNGNGAKNYFNNPNAALASDPAGYNNNTYCSCTQAAGAIVRGAVDPDFDMSGDPTKYLKGHPEKWVLAGYVRHGQKLDDVCQPGDLLSVQTDVADHVMIYVGHELVKSRFPNSNANVYQGGYDKNNIETCWCPHLDYEDGVDARRAFYEIWRPTGGGDSYYPKIDVDKVLNGPLQTGSFW